ncbi:MAG: metal ABC transporter permease [Succinivibrio sp.]
MIDIIQEMLSYPFMLRALVTGLCISAAASCIGVCLVLKHYSMIGDGLSHVGFASLALAVVLNQSPLYVSLPIVVLCACALLQLPKKAKLQSDAAIALISTAALSGGVMMLSLTTGMNTDVCNYLFGSILGIKVYDTYITVVLCLLILALFIAFYQKIFAITFDETFARACGMNVGRYNFILALMCAVIIVLGMKMMGALLISNLIVLPAITAMRVCRQFKTVVLYSVLISIICFFSGLLLSYVFSTPTGASVVLVNVALFIIHVIIERLYWSR